MTQPALIVSRQRKCRFNHQVNGQCIAVTALSKNDQIAADLLLLDPEVAIMPDRCSMLCARHAAIKQKSHSSQRKAVRYIAETASARIVDPEYRVRFRTSTPLMAGLICYW